MGKALVIKGADFSSNALAQIIVISDEVRALFNGHNVGETGLYAFQRFINSIGGLNGSLWSKVGRMYVPMLFEPGTTASDTFFDVKNNTVLGLLPSNYVSYSYSNSSLIITTTSERTTVYPFTIGDAQSLASMFGIFDTHIAGIASSITIKTGYTPRWARRGSVTWDFTTGKTITVGSNTLKIAVFGDSEDNSELSHGFIRNDGTVDSEAPSITGTVSENRTPMLQINPSGANIALMVVGYFKSGLTNTELKTVTSALYQMYLDINS